MFNLPLSVKQEHIFYAYVFILFAKNKKNSRLLLDNKRQT